MALTIYTATPKVGKKTPYDAVEFTGSVSQVDVAAWAKGRLKGGSGRFIIEIPQEDGSILVAQPYTVILRDAKGRTKLISSLEFRQRFNFEPKEAAS